MSMRDKMRDPGYSKEDAYFLKKDSEEGAVRHPHPRLQTQRDDHDVRRAQYAGRLDYRDLYAEASSSGMDPVSQSDQTFRAKS